MAIFAALPRNLFTSPSKNPKISNPASSKPPPPPIPIPKYPKPEKSQTSSNPQNPAFSPNPKNPAFKSVHLRTKYYKPVSDGVIASEGDRAVVIGESGVSYLLPGAPFEFQFSYSETPKEKPLAIREPAFLPFAPPTMSRPWTGKAPLKKSKKNIPLFDSFNPPPEGTKGVKNVQMPGPFKFGKFPQEGKTREEVLGDPLSRMEVKMLIKPHLSHNRQVNLGRDGLTHNMLELIHSHWKRQRVCKVRCRGVPTVDMDNVCYHLEEKTGGKIIHRKGGVLYLFRGRNYNYRTRPQYPVMLWKPAAPVYPKLIQEAPEGLTTFEAEDLRKKGKALLPICKLAKNGIYMDLVKDVRNAFEGSPLVKVDCKGLDPSDYKKIGAKLKELVPCVLLSFDEEQILMWRGKDWKSMYSYTPSFADLYPSSNGVPSFVDVVEKPDNGFEGAVSKIKLSSPKIASLWKRAVESNKALLLDEVKLEPDSLLEQVEAFEGSAQVTGDSSTSISTNEDAESCSRPDDKDRSDFEMPYDDDEDEYYVDDSFEDGDSPAPFGSLPVDSITEGLTWE